MKGAVVVAGAVARRIEAGGHVWALLQWALGFRQLGWSVLFLDRLEPGRAARLAPRPALRRDDGAVGLADGYSLDLGSDDEPVGLGRDAVRARPLVRTSC